MKLTSRPQIGLIPLALASLITLSACSENVAAQEVQALAPLAAEIPLEEERVAQGSEAELSGPGWVTDVPRIDEQGAVTVEITPLNLNVPGHTLDFSVALNTHSVDLSMDLASLAKLTTDTGIEVQAAAWDAPRGGHHVQGVLEFPAALDGAGVMNGVQRLTLVIRGLDAPERTFVWEK